ncbi:MAG: hypothetical protein PVG25_14080 [Anaerolineae bacterium]
MIRFSFGILLVASIMVSARRGSSVRPDRVRAGGPEDPTGSSLALVSPLNSELTLPYYGMHGVFSSDLATVSDLGTEVILMSFRHDGTPEEWLAYLNAASAEDIRVIAWLWPQGWHLEHYVYMPLVLSRGPSVLPAPSSAEHAESLRTVFPAEKRGSWQIDEQARLFLQTVSAHPALFAVYALHEPYWNGCWGCGYTTTQQQALYSAIKSIADVPIHSAVDSMSAWTRYAEEQDKDTAFADGMCDYCETWYHPFREDDTFEKATLISHVEADLAVARARAPNAKIVWSMQCFAQEVPLGDDYRMPTAEEMRDLASIVYSRGVDGALWYPWDFQGGLYSDFLSNHPELYPVVREIYDEIVRSPQ